MDALDVVLAVEQGDSGHTPEEILAGIAEHRESLRKLQGSWGRLIARLEQEGAI